jgi:cytochrome P450
MTQGSKPPIDFDHHSAAYVEGWEAMADDLHRSPAPLAWSPHYGGFWVLASWAQCKAVAEDWQTFSSDNDPEGVRGGGKGVMVPPQPYPLVLSESDPPLSVERRRIENPFFAMPKALKEWESIAQDHLDEAIDDVMHKGQADLVDEIVIPTTARTTLRILGVDLDNWQDAALSAHRFSFTKAGDPDYPAAEMARLRESFRSMLRDRRETPRGDLVSALASGMVQGRPLSDDEGESMMSALVFGGFDTTATALLHALIWLDTHRDEHARLLASAGYMANAIEEFLRVYPPATGVARNLTRDVELLGHTLRKGERIYLWYAAANRDPTKFERPRDVQLDRANARDHLSFSAGGHRCLGLSLAKLEIRTALSTILKRLPDYRIDHGAIVRYPSYGIVYGMAHVPVYLTPGSPVAAGSPT